MPGGAPTEGIYWRYEVFLKFLESRLNMVLGANGALFAVRRELFEPVPPLGVIDDFLIAMRVRAKGYRIVYDPEATGEEDLAPDVRHEFKRRVRIGAGNFYALRYTHALLSPSAGNVVSGLLVSQGISLGGSDPHGDRGHLRGAAGAGTVLRERCAGWGGVRRAGVAGLSIGIAQTTQRHLPSRSVHVSLLFPLHAYSASLRTG